MEDIYFLENPQNSLENTEGFLLTSELETPDITGSPFGVDLRDFAEEEPEEEKFWYEENTLIPTTPPKSTRPKNPRLPSINNALNFIWTQIIPHFSAIFIAGLFVVLGFAVFGSSVKFGLAVGGGFLMTGALATPLVVFMLAALSVAVIAHLVIRSLDFFVVDTPTAQAIAAILSAQKRLKIWENLEKEMPEEMSQKMQMRFTGALIEDAGKIKQLFTESLHHGVIDSDFPDLKKSDKYIALLEHIEEEKNTGLPLPLKNRDLFKDILLLIAKIKADPDYRANGPSAEKKVSVVFATSAALLVVCVLILSNIFTVGTTTGMAWSMILAAMLGMASFFSAKYGLDKTSGGAYATLAVVAGAGFLIFLTLLGLYFSHAAVGLSLSVLMPVTISLGLLFAVCAIFAEKHQKRDPKERVKQLEPFKQFSWQLKALLIAGPVVSLGACIVPLFFMFAGASSWLILLSIPAGFICLVLTDHMLNSISDSPWGTLAALSLIGLVSTVTVRLLIGAAGMPMVFLGAGVGLFILFATSVFLVYKEKDKTPKRVGQNGERLLQIVRVFSAVAFLFLTFLSIAMVFQLNNIGQLSGITAFAFNVIAQMLGYGGFQVGLQWISAFFVSIFAISGFALFELIKNSLQISPASTAEIEKHKNLLETGIGVLKLTFVVGLMTLLMMKDIFSAAATTSILPAFIVVVGVMTLFSGNIKLPYFQSFNHLWNEKLFHPFGFNMGLGVTTLFDKQVPRLWLRYISRELAVAGILFVISIGPYFAAGKGLIPFAVLAIGAAVTMLFRWRTMWRNVHDVAIDQYQTGSIDSNEKIIFNSQGRMENNTSIDDILSKKHREFLGNSQSSGIFFPHDYSQRRFMLRPRFSTLETSDPSQGPEAASNSLCGYITDFFRHKRAQKTSAETEPDNVGPTRPARPDKLIPDSLPQVLEL